MILRDDVDNDVLMLTINALCYVYNVITVHKIVIKFVENLHYCKFFKIFAFSTKILRLS